MTGFQNQVLNTAGSERGRGLADTCKVIDVYTPRPIVRRAAPANSRFSHRRRSTPKGGQAGVTHFMILKQSCSMEDLRGLRLDLTGLGGDALARPGED
jgi:hypothetical protein